MQKPKSAGRRLISRRNVLRSAAGGLLAAMGVGAYARYVEPFWYEIVERSMPLFNLPAHAVGLRLVQLSDLHVGRTDDDYLRSALHSVAALEPDLLVITGDFTSLKTVDGATHLRRILKCLQLGRLGTFACLGNHDYGRNWRDEKVGDAVTRTVDDLGVRVLRNERIDCEGIQFAGIDDLWGPNFSPNDAFHSINPNLPAITLCHNPDGCDLPIWSNFRGWILAGHTHGGQCRPPFMAPPVLPVSNPLYVAGEYHLSGGRRLYINRALGWARQMRFNVRPEITVFTLNQAV